MEMVWAALFQILHRIGIFDFILGRIPKIYKLGERVEWSVYPAGGTVSVNVQLQIDLFLISDQRGIQYGWKEEFTRR